MTDFEQVYRTYFRDVYLYVKSLARDDDVAEEVTGEAFFKALKAIDSFRGDCDIRVWLCQIAKNCFFSYCKRHAGAVSMEEIDAERLSPPQASAEEVLTGRENVMEIHAALHALGEPYKEVFTLRVFGELSFRDIGRLFSKSENWACVTYHRARGKIMAKMEENNVEKGM